jgi:hypothetical protein
MFAKLNPIAFLIAFAVGILFIYLATPPPDVVIKFPTPWNAGDVVYRQDTTDTCFVYKADKSTCPMDRSLIRPQPPVTA